MKNFIATLALLMSTAAFSAYAAEAKVQKEIKVGSFTGIVASTALDIEFTQGPAKVIAEGKPSDIDQLKVEVKSNNLNLSVKQPGATVKIKISNPKLQEISLSGAVDMAFMSDLSVNDLDVSMVAATSIKFKNVKCTRLTFDIGGASDVRMKDVSCLSLSLDMSEATDFKADNIKAPDFSAGGSGASDVKIETLECQNYDSRMSGAGDIAIQKLTAVYVNSESSGSSEFSSRKLNAHEVTIGLSGASEANIPELDAKKLKVGASGASEADIEGRAGEVKASASGTSEIDIRGLKHDSIKKTTSGMSSIRE
ncbi:MAG: DUF2807 domain-containing protein [Muribaculaceae bacterium]|nr:DUF2807 domain-containing protein [Muribaculaceae bacterium]